MPDSAAKIPAGDIPLFAESAKSSLSNLAGTILSILQVIVLTAFLPVTDVGLFFFYITLVFLFAQVTKGVAIGLRKRVSTPDTDPASYFYAAATIATGLLLTLITLLVTIEPVINTYTSITVTRNGLFIVGVATAAKSYLLLMTMYVGGCGHPGLANQIRNYVGRGLQLAFMLAGLALIDTSVTVAMTGYGAGLFLAAIILTWHASIPLTRPSPRHIRSLLAFAKWSIPNTVANDFYQRFDTILLSVLVGSLAVGFYDTSVRLSAFGFAFAAGIAATSTVKLSGLHDTDRAITPTIRKALSTSTVFVYPALIITIIHAGTILTLTFGAAYADARWYLILILAYQVLQAYRKQYESIFNALDTPRTITTTSLAAAGINIITAPLFVLAIGGIGVVVSTILSEFARFIIYQTYVRDELSSYIIPAELYQQPLIATGILGLLWTRTHLVPVGPYTGLVVDTVICTTVFFGVCMHVSPAITAFLHALLDQTHVRKLYTHLS